MTSTDPFLEVGKLFWGTFGERLADWAIGGLKESWRRFNWIQAEAEYKQRLLKLHGKARILGFSRDIQIEKIFTHVYIMNELTALQNFELAELQARPPERESLNINAKRRRALPLILRGTSLFILGKPGAGKTTFLKYLTIQACRGNIQRTPILISLTQWANSGLDLIGFIEQEFAICNFPDARAFIVELLKQGKAFVLFDGLDEVNQEKGQRARAIQELETFSKSYPGAQICLTSRIAAVDYSFSQFTYVEIADFDETQIRSFASQWFSQTHERKLFLKELDEPQNYGLREIATTPLLLTLVCLVYETNHKFPTRRIDLYTQAINALLEKWDEARGVTRTADYRWLSLPQKRQVLASLAKHYFDKGEYFFQQDALERRLVRVVADILGSNKKPGDFNGQAILKSIEAQHGLLTERATRVYSFMHLTFQEYFTARYIVDYSDKSEAKRLLEQHLTDRSWQEVIYFTSSLIDDPVGFLTVYLEQLGRLAKTDAHFHKLLQWVEQKSSISNRPGSQVRAGFLAIALARILPSSFALAHSLANDLPPYYFEGDRFFNVTRQPDTWIRLGRDFKLARGVGVELQETELELLRSELQLNSSTVNNYLLASLLLLRCLKAAVISDPQVIQEHILLP